MSLASHNQSPATQDAMGRVHLLAKRFFDVVGASSAVILLSPVLLAAALAVKLQDGGPVIYRRRCVGPQGDFDAFKLRSMCLEADRYLDQRPDLMAEFVKSYKLNEDPRITPVGAFLRKTSIDELPQLFNVLRGEMSLVGPRMITRPELEKYGDKAAMLLSVRPGMTGYWQVAGRQKVEYKDRVEMDMYYISHRSLLLDLQILFKTPLKVLKREGAY
jgi:lipopolysaccharide/colanic/teichoic acid biosynthesis glycosyltransferase